MKNFRYIAAMALLIVGAMAVFAQNETSAASAGMEGGCHFVVEVDSTTGTRTMLPASKARRVHNASTADGLGKYGTSGLGVISTIGEITIPVIMVDFSDVSFLPTTTIEKVEAWFNGENYTDNGNVGSVRQYFIDQSKGMFRPRFKVLGISHTGKPVATYGAGSSNQENVEGLSHAVTGNYGYDGYTQKSGIYTYVPLCVIYYAGEGQHRGASSDRIWAKFVEYTSGYDHASLFSQYFKSYLYINEANGNSMDGIGTACHELSHAFGLPDVYDTSGSGCRTPGLWSLMSAGNYCMDGHSPVDLCAYERSMLGWLQIQELTTAGNYRLAPTEAALIRNASNSKEYYIMENRTGTRWTPSTMSGGMLVYHIDYDANAWQQDKVNVNDSHPRMMFVAADNVQSDATHFDYQRDLYPYLTNDSLTLRSVPAMTAYTGSFSGKPVYNIRRDGQDITFDFITRGSATPIVTPDQKEVVEQFYPERSLGKAITSLTELKANKRYALYNAHFNAYIVYAPKYSKTHAWTASMKGDASHTLASANYGRAYDVTSNFGAWKVNYNAPYITLQNEGSEFYLTTPGNGSSPACDWSENYATLSVTTLSSGHFAFTSTGGSADYLCAAPQLKDYPLSVWYNTDDGCSWQILEIEGSEIVTGGESATGRYTLGAPITSTSEIADGTRYAIYNPHFQGYAIASPEHSTTQVWTAELQGDVSHPLNPTGSYSSPYDPCDANHRWLITPASGGRWYVMNEGTGTYLRTDGYTNGAGPTAFTSAQESLAISTNAGGTFGFNRSGNQYDYMCASPQLSYPIGNWDASDSGSLWQIIVLDPEALPTGVSREFVATPQELSSPTYDLTGRPLHDGRRAPGLYITNRRVVLR